MIKIFGDEYRRYMEKTPMTEHSISKGRELYEKHCISCHALLIILKA